MLNIPIYKAIVRQDDATGINAISLVEEPATEVNWMCFNEQTKTFNFSIDNEEERIVSGVIMLADTPIYRHEGDFEFYVCYDKDTIKMMSEKMLKEGTFNNIDTAHNGKKVDGVNMLEVFIKDSKKGLNPNYVNNVPDGSLMGSFKVENDQIWKEIKDGTFRGFSLSGLFRLEEPRKDVGEDDEILSLIAEISKKIIRK